MGAVVAQQGYDFATGPPNDEVLLLCTDIKNWTEAPECEQPEVILQAIAARATTAFEDKKWSHLAPVYGNYVQ